MRGTITTDGTIGVLAAGKLLAWQRGLIDHRAPASNCTLTIRNSPLVVFTGSALSATVADLPFDFGGSGEAWHPGQRPGSVQRLPLLLFLDRRVIDGPCTETMNPVAGFRIWTCASMEDAVEWVKKCPNPMPTDSEIEIRQIHSAEDFGAALTPE